MTDGRRRWVRVGRRAGAGVALVLAVLLVSAVIVDLGPLLRGPAERGARAFLKRDVRIGQLSVRLLAGRFLIADLHIGGLEASDRPFFTARRIEVAMTPAALRRREVLVDSVVLTDWRMLVETWPNGRHSFPKLTRDGPKGPKRFTTTVTRVTATRGEFIFEDHGTPWSAVARNLEVTVAKTDGYGGEAHFRDGTVRIQQYQPMQTDFDTAFTIDGGLVRLSRLTIASDGSRTVGTGVVDLGKWPEQTYHVQSRVDFPRMREIFWPRETWRLGGTGDFTGTFHLFKGGRELKGTFASAQASVNQYRFTDLRGSLLWVPDRFEVTDATTAFYGGQAQFDYSMAPLGRPRERARMRWDAAYTDVDLATLSDGLGFDGLRLAGRATGRNLLEWPSGAFRERRGEGRIEATPPAGVRVATREIAPDLLAAVAAEGVPWGPFNPDPRLLGYLPVGGSVSYRLDPEWIHIGPSAVASPRTYVAFEGRTAYGQSSDIPFHVSSADWQESDRVLAGIMTAFGAPTGAVPVGGHGRFDGTMTAAFTRPQIEGRFAGDGMRAWDVVWGQATADLVIENGYVTLTDARVTSGESVIETDGTFSLGYPRRDGGEEINARVRVARRALTDLRHAFLLDDYPIDGALSGEFHLYGRYETPFGFGRMTIERVVAYGEPFDGASAALRFEGAGVRLDGIEAAKAEGRFTGAAYVGWNGTYSFNVSGRSIPVESLALASFPEAPLSGVLEMTASGSGAFESPRYDARLSVADLFVKDEGIGAVTARLSVRNRTLGVELEAASPRLLVSGTGRIAMTPEADAEVTIRATETSLDPYIRLFEPRLSPFTRVVAGGTLRVSGELGTAGRLQADLVVDHLAATLFDYQVRNDGPLRVTLDGDAVQVASVRLVGDGTRLEVTGGATTGTARTLDLHATGGANLGILQGFFRDIRSAGQAELRADLTGTFDRPIVSGSAAVAGGRLRHFALPHALDALNGRVLFDASGLRFDGVTARLGGGLVRVGGRIDAEALVPTEFNVTASGEAMRLRFPEGFQSVVDADLSLRGLVEAPVLGGTVLVRSSVWDRRFQLGGNLLELVGAGRSVAVTEGAAAATAFPVRFDVRVLAPSTLRIDNNLARIVSRADLTLRGTYDRPLLFGRAEIERGDLTFEGRRYVVTRGAIDFSNPNRIEPFFDVEAETRVRAPGQTYQITLAATGTVERFSWSLDSDPPLPRVDILALLLSDRAPADTELAALRSPNELEQQILQARAAQFLVSPISSEVGRVVEQTFGVDTFQITPSLTDPSQQSTRLTPGARLTIGKRISSRVYLTFSQNLSASSTTRDQIILLEYDQSDRLSWILSQNEDRTYALDVRVRHTF